MGNLQRVYWQQDFVKSDQLYLLDGARVRYDEQPGILYEHRMLRDNLPILEKPRAQFQNLPVGETISFTLNSEDSGLFSFLEVRFFKRQKLTASFAAAEQKTLQFVIPDYDDLTVRIRVRGSGSTRLFSVKARVTSLDGLIYAGDRALSENIGLLEIIGDDEKMCVSFSKDLHYLAAEFFRETKPQLHFASLDGSFDPKIVTEFILQQAPKELLLFQAPADILSILSQHFPLTIIE
ncbi:MAG: hypothetical protein LBV19_01365 [Streptococcaceae bacterium]|nr:hypothetical protein [Streptococcaceae bacterium]